MKLKELVKSYPKVPYIGIYEEDETGKVKAIYPDFADEMVETFGNKEVADYRYIANKKTLVVEFAE